MVRETYRICLDPAFQYLKKIPYLIRCRHRIRTIKKELKFLKMFLWGLVYCEESEHDQHLSAIISSLVPQMVDELKGNVERMGQVETSSLFAIIEPMELHMDEIIKKCKRHAREICILLLDGGGTFKCNSHQHNQKLFASFTDYVLKCLQALLDSDIEFSDLKAQIIFIQGKLEEFSSFSNSMNYSKIRVKKLSEFIFQTQNWICHISPLVLLYWIDGMNQSLASSMETLFASLMHKIMPYTPGVIASYFPTMIPKLFASYLDFLLEDSAMSIKGEVEILREGLIFLVSFVVEAPEEDSEDKGQILAQIDAIIDELPSLVCSIRVNYEMTEGFCRPNFSGLLQKIDGVKAKVRELYVLTTGSSQLNSPKTNPMGFLDLLLRTMKRMIEAKVSFVPSTKHRIELIQRQLELLKPFLQRRISLQNERREFKELWVRTIDVLYHASYITNLCLAETSSLWYSIVCLPSVIEHIKLIRAEFHKIEDSEMDSSIALPWQSMTSKTKEVFIGFKKDLELMIDYLIGGRDDLTIISISGMPGQGKTTLARKIYNDTRIRLHFPKIVWCYVSKECKDSDLLIRMGSELLGPHVSSLEATDIADNLRKRLKRQRYLIVMDDIWDVSLWNQVKILFPDDRNGSRILFTSRNDDIASQTRMNSISHSLPLFSEEESLELMQDKLFTGCSSGSVPLEFFEIAKQIVENCKGLPLAVATVASLLQRIERKLDLWNEVAENLKSHLHVEGCMNVIELSYKYLPEYLKPCFLYFGVFPRGEEVDAGKLKRLWMSEGFIKDDGEMQYSEEALAKEYLDYLVSQNLVITVERGSLGEIKTCNLHDLLYDLCLEKAKEENFLNWTDKDLLYQCSFGGQSYKYNHHRLSIRSLDSFIKSKPICTRMELPTSRVHSLLWHALDVEELSYELSFGICNRLKVLTLLDLEGVVLPSEKFPKFLTSLVHLRYLALFFIDEIDGVPTSIANLWNLETLVIIAEGFTSPLPVSMWNMKRLRYVDLPCTLLHLDDATIELINNSSLTTLGTLYLTDDCKTVEFLRKLSRLRKLKCRSLKIQKEVDCSKCASSIFRSLTQLESLHLQGLELPDSCKRSQLLLNFHENLTKLCLYNLFLPWSALSVIVKQLPSLLVLKLFYRSFEGSSWRLEDGDFPKLRCLSLNDLDIEEMDISACDDTPFPCLERFVLCDCEKFKEIPSSFEEIATLNSITIEGSSCEKILKESGRQILETQRDLGNEDLQLYVNEYLEFYVSDENEDEDDPKDGMTKKGMERRM